MYTLDATDSFRVRDPPDTYIYDIVPTTGGLVTISSDNSLRLLDPLALDTPLSTVKKINTDITCVVAIGGDDGSGSLIGTAGRDGRLVLTDFRSQKVGEIKNGK
jgi:WD40 repeat protein